MSDAGFGVMQALTEIGWEPGQAEVDCEQLAQALREQGWTHGLGPTDTPVLTALIDDLEYGNIPGSKLQLKDRVVWLHSTDNVKAWLSDWQRAAKAGT